MLNKKSILIALTLVATVTILGFRSSHSLQNGTDEDEYKNYVLRWIDEFQAVQEKDPIVFGFEKDNPEKTSEPIKLRLDKLNEFNYPNVVPAKYTDIHTKLLETISVYKENYDSLYEGIVAENSQLIGTSVGFLYESDFALQEIEDTLRSED